MIKAVLFDFDGTLADTSESIILGFQYVFDRHAPNLKTDKKFFQSILGPSLKEIFPIYFPGQDIDAIIQEYRDACRPYHNAEHTYLYPHASETLDELHKMGIKVCIFTSRSRESAHNLLEMLGILNKVDYFIGYEDVEKAKPDPDGIHKVLKHFNYKPEDIIMVGDHGHDINAAKAAGTIGIGVSYSFYGAERLHNDGAFAIVDDLYEIVDIIKKIQG